MQQTVARLPSDLAATPAFSALTMLQRLWSSALSRIPLRGEDYIVPLTVLKRLERKKRTKHRWLVRGRRKGKWNAMKSCFISFRKRLLSSLFLSFLSSDYLSPSCFDPIRAVHFPFLSLSISAFGYIMGCNPRKLGLIGYTAVLYTAQFYSSTLYISCCVASNACSTWTIEYWHNGLIGSQQ